MSTAKRLTKRNQLSSQLLEELLAQIGSDLSPYLRDTAESADSIRLTRRELECLCLSAEGKSVSEIALVLSRKSSTVKSHLKSVRQKIGVRSTKHAAIIAIKRGMIT